jgi:hypothetical protein
MDYDNPDLKFWVGLVGAALVIVMIVWMLSL